MIKHLTNHLRREILTSSTTASTSKIPCLRISQPSSTRRYVTPSSSLLVRRDSPGGPRSSRSSRSSRPPPSSSNDPDFPSSSSNSNSYIPPASTIPVHLGNDPQGVLKDTSGAVRLLANSGLVIVRQLEMLNVFMGFEQANRYAILDPEGNHVGYMAEEDGGIATTMSRQFLRTHRPFKSVIMDREGEPVLHIRRPFAFINSRIYVHSTPALSHSFDSDSEAMRSGARTDEEAGYDRTLVGEAQQEWHPWRRRYNLFKHSEGKFKQFAKIDSGLWAWDFYLSGPDDRVMASINRNFAGFGRELFTDTGQYVVRFDAVEQEMLLGGGSSGGGVNSPSPLPSSLVIPPSSNALTLDERAMTLATAVSIDFDYFSRHSGGGGMGLPFFIWGGGGGEDLDRGGSQEQGEVLPRDSESGLDPPGMGAGVGAAGAGMANGIFGQQGEGEVEEGEESGPYDPYEGAASGQRGTVDPYDPYGDVMEDEAPGMGDFDADFEDPF